MTHSEDTTLTGTRAQHPSSPPTPPAPAQGHDEDYELVASAIDARMAQLESEGFKEIALVSLMVDQARCCHRLMCSASTQQLSACLLRYPRLRRFAVFLAILQCGTLPDRSSKYRFRGLDPRRCSLAPARLSMLLEGID